MRKIFRIVGWILGIILVIVLSILIVAHTPFGKNLVRKQVLAFVHKNITTEFAIGEIDYLLPYNLELNNVWIKDQQGDTLLALGKLDVRINPLTLIYGKITIPYVGIEGLYADVNRQAPDSVFNFNFILESFAGADSSETIAADTSSSNLKIALGKVALNNIRLKFDDFTGGTQLSLALKSLLLTMDHIDINQMIFDINSLDVQGLHTSFFIDSSLLPPTIDTTPAGNFALSAKQINLQEINFLFHDKVSETKFQIDLAKLFIKPRKTDLTNQIIDIRELILDSSNIVIAMSSNDDPSDQTTDTAVIEETKGWTIVADKLALNGINFKMDDHNAPALANGIDFSHLAIQKLNFRAAEIFFTTDSISGNLEHLSLKEKSGLDLQELRTKFAYHNQGASLEDLYLKTRGTVLQNRLDIKYPSLEALQQDPGSMSLDVQLTKSAVYLNDVILFVPDLLEQEFFATNRNEVIQLEALLKGNLKRLEIEQFGLNGFEETEVKLKGTIQNLTETELLAYEIDIDRIRSSERDLELLLPDSLRQQFRLPESFGLTGTLAGNLKDINTELTLITTEGNIFVGGIIKTSEGANNELYRLNLKTDRLNLGYLLRQDTVLGLLSTDLSVRGKSFEPKTMFAQVNGNIHLAQFKGYDYHGISLKGRNRKGQAELHLDSEDPNLRLALAAEADLRDSIPAVFAQLRVDSIDLYALNLAEGPFKIRTVIDADIPKADFDYPEGVISIHNTVVLLNEVRHQPDSMYIVARSHRDSGQNILISLDILHATVKGDIPLSGIGPAINSHINRHFQMDTIADPAKEKLAEPYNLNVYAHIANRATLKNLAPELKRLDTISLSFKLDEQKMNLRLRAPQITYGTTEIDSVLVGVEENETNIKFRAGIRSFTQSDFELRNTGIDGKIEQQTIHAALHIRDSNRADQFLLATQIRQVDSNTVIAIEPNLIINYNPWKVATPNEIVLGSPGFYINNLDLRYGEKRIHAHSEQPAFQSPLVAEINNLSIGEITRIVSKTDSFIADGTINARVQLKQMEPALLFDANASISELSFMNTRLGDIKLNAAADDENTIQANISVSGEGNDIRLSGNYHNVPVAGDNLDFRLVLNAVSLKSLQGLTKDFTRNNDGFIRGELVIKGTTDQPLINGTIITDQLATTITQLGMWYRMPYEKISINNNVINFDKFAILDSTRNEIKIEGKIDAKDFAQPKLALQIRAKDFKALSSTARDNKMFYGSVVINTNLSVKGIASAPDIGGSIGINRGTNFTVVLPESEVKINETDGIVEFFDSRDSSANNLLRPADTLSTKIAFQPGGDINVNISIDSAAEFKLIVDPGTGDNLRVRGSAALNAAITPGGDLTLTGSYELRGGAYQLNYNFIRRRFDIVAGSSILFAGDPLDAHMNITAAYEANVAPYDLVEKQVPDPSQLNFYKQRLPFQVYLKMQGKLMQPFISFDIDLPEGGNYRMATEGVDLVQARLTQLRTDTSELNKQVFAVLILNRFVGEDPFASEGTGVSTMARQSASRFISEQLNRYASGLVSGVDLNFDLVSSEDYTTGERRERTDLSIAASKSMFDDRLTVTVGNDFALENSQSGGQQNTSLIPGNLAADYRLTGDGRYLLRAYRRDRTEGIMQGTITETGLTFITTHEFNRFKNLINRKRRHREWMQRINQNQQKDQ